MRLARAQIRNFRSIANITLAFEPRCRVLVGINEAGKTNILKALSLLSPSATPGPTDRREIKPGEKYGQESYVRFIFRLDSDDREELVSAVTPRLLATDPERPVLESDGATHTLSQLCKAQREGIYTVDINNNRRTGGTWSLSASFRAISGLMKPSSAVPSDYAVQLPDGRAAPLAQSALVHAQDFPQIPAEYFVQATPQDVSAVVARGAWPIVERELPHALLWDYKEANLLPGQVQTTAFASNPDSCLPLKHMFLLAGISDITVALTEARTRPNGLRNILSLVGTQATKHMRNVWPEYREIKISLSPNGEMIDAAIQDRHNQFEMSRRSDGFKRFITFLLMVSCQAKTKCLVDSLLLYDEPDTSLHPSGARHLRNDSSGSQLLTASSTRLIRPS